FGLKPDWVIRFADLIEKENLKFRFMIQSRADLLVVENYVSALKRAGCETVWMGAESGSQGILDAMDKGTTIDQIRKATHLLKKHQVRSAFFLQFGYLGETMADIQKTIALLNELLPDDIGISVSYPLPGTGFYEKVKNDLKNKQNWSDSDDLTLMFRNTYHPDFYKQLHRYVHKNYRKHQGYEGLRNLLRLRMSKTNMRRAASLMYYVPVVFNEYQKLKRVNHDWN
ncbi:MAG: B12-binding domain-containing radical SAM protein, partial [Bacteroidia bacterium]